MPFPAGELIAAIRMDGMAQFERDNARAEDRFKATGAAAKNAGDVATRALQTAAAATTTLAAVGVGYLTTLFKTGAAYNTLQQTSRAALKTMLGGAEAANDQMAKLDDFARNSPFSKAVFIQAQQQLLGFGVEAKRIIPILGAIQDAVAATGGSSNSVGEIAGIFAKIQSQGRITGEELLQLGGRGIDAAALIGKAFGTTAEDIKKRITEGTLTAEDALDGLAKGMVATYGGAAAEVKKTWSGTTDRIKAASREIGAALAEPFISQQGGGYAIMWGNQVADVMRAVLSNTTPVVNILEARLLPAFAGFTRFLDSAKVAIKSWDSSNFESFLNKAEQYAPAVGALSGAILGLTGRALAGVPVLGALVGGLNPVVAALAGAAAASPEVRQALGDLLSAFSPLVPVVADLAGLFASGLNIAIPVVADSIELLAAVAQPLIKILAAIPPPVLAAVAAFFALNQATGPLVPILDGVIETMGILTQAAMVAWAEEVALGTGKIAAGFKVADGALTGLAGSLLSFTANPAALILLGIAAAGAALAAAFVADAQAAQKASDQTAAYRDSLEGAEAAITSLTKAQIKKNLEDAGAIEAGKALGLRTEQLVAAIMGNRQALDAVSEAYKKNAGATGGYAEGQKGLANEAGIVNGTVLEQARLLEDARQAQIDAARDAKVAAAAMDETARSNARMNDALAIARDVSRDATERLKALKQALDELNGGSTSAAEAEKVLNDQTRTLAEAFAQTDENGNKLAAGLVDQSGKIDTTTAAGSRLFDSVKAVNDEMILAIQRAHDAAVARGEDGLSMEAAAAAAQPYIDTIRTIASEAGLSEPQVQGLINTMLATPAVVAFALTDDGSIDAEKLRLIDLATQITSTPDKDFQVSSDDFPGLMQALAALGYDINNLPIGNVTVVKNDGSFQSAENALSWLARQRTVTLVVNEVSSSGNAVYQQGGRRLEQFGGLYQGGVKAYALGTMTNPAPAVPSGLYAGRPGGLIKMAEPWLAWEAYISPDRGAREKNIAIAHEALSRLGAPVRPSVQAGYATGAFLEGSSVAAPRWADSIGQAAQDTVGGGSRTTNVTIINPYARDIEQDAWEAAQLIGGA